MKIVKKKDQSLTNSGYQPLRTLFDEFFQFPSFMEDFGRNLSYENISADVWEEGDNFFVKMAIPGVKKDDVDITITADSVTVKGKAEESEEQKSNRKYYFRSMESSFEQTFNMPTKVDADSSKAEYNDGVLLITLPKAPEFKPKQIKISAQ